jgi:hypothetical protein
MNDLKVILADTKNRLKDQLAKNESLKRTIAEKESEA